MGVAVLVVLDFKRDRDIFIQALMALHMISLKSYADFIPNCHDIYDDVALQAEVFCWIVTFLL